VAAVVGPPRVKDVLGLLIDESIPVPNCPTRRASKPKGGLALADLRTVKRLNGLIDTVTAAHDNMATAAFKKYVVRLPAGGYSATQYDMTNKEREALVEAGRQATRAFLADQSVLGVSGAMGFADVTGATALANEAAAALLQR